MLKELELFNKLWPLIRSHQWLTFTILCLGALASLAESISISLMIPLLQSFESDTFETAHQTELIKLLNVFFGWIASDYKLVVIALVITLAILVKSVLAYLNKALFSRLNQQISHQLRSKIFSKLLNVKYSFLEKKNSGDLLNLLSTESWKVGYALEMLANIVISAFTLFIFALILLLISWQLVVLVALSNLLISVVVNHITYRSKQLGKYAVEANSSLNALMYEGLTGMRTIRVLNRENYEQHRFETQSIKVRTVFWRLDLLYGIVDPLHEGLSAILIVAILVVSLVYKLTALSAILTFMFMLYRLQPHIKLIDAYRVNLLAADGGVNAVMSFVDWQDDHCPTRGYTSFTELEQGIVFDRVSFRYGSSDSFALKDISLHIPSKKTTALVGPSGAGKSTLMNLICRFYDATSGNIYADQRLLQQLNVEDWRGQIALVSQDAHIFSSTIRENIAYGRLNATEDDIIQAAKQANAHEFICDLNEGYDTLVGDCGIKLSDGQRQRLVLARAIVRNPSILILDEATNALDTLSEHLIQEALDRFKHERTVIVIAHRLSTIEQADQIVVFNKGEIAERGTLRELLNNRGLFNQLYQLQHKGSLNNTGYGVSI